jgi:heme exporter protein A
MLEAANLACVRGENTLFSGLSFALERGTLLRVGGPNGSGKTSLLRIVCGLMLPAEGDVLWNGESIRRLREEFWKDLVYVGHVNAIKDDLTALENLAIGAQLVGRAVGDAAGLQALQDFGIARCAPLPARVLSQGQKRRVSLARLAVSRSAPLWVLDEPFNALDAAAVEFMRRLIGEQLTSGGTIVLTTHQEVTVDAPREQRVELGA